MPSAQWLLLIAVFAPVISGVATLWMPKAAITSRTLLSAVGTLVSFLLFLGVILRKSATFGVAGSTDGIEWVNAIHLNLAFTVEGLGGFFALLVSGIGVMIVLYARGYFGPDAKSLYRFYPTLGFFTTAMLGIVVSDYTILTLLFWEMTAISSFLLIGWEREDARSVRLAIQAFVTTGLGGLTLFAGLVWLGQEAGIWRWTQFYAYGAQAITFTDPAVRGAFLLILVGALTKSAQFPFHYWLPGAMAAPTPVSAFLHSATMVKAGVFLAGRLFPVFGAPGHDGTGFDLFPAAIIPLGAITMLWAAVVAIQKHDLKQIFAYTTVSQLGLLMTMYGLGAFTFEHDGHAMVNLEWDVTQIANHAFYKAPLFIIAGALGHVASRSLPRLNGAFYKHKGMCITMLLAGYALAALPGSISFPAKEFFLYQVYHAKAALGWGWIVLMGMTVVTAICNVGIFVRLFTTLLGLPGGMKADPDAHHDEHPHHEHEHSPWAHLIWLPGLAIVSLQFVGGLFPGLWEATIGTFETSHVIGMAHYYNEHIPAFYQPFLHPSLPLYMSLIAIAGGVALGLSPLCRKPVTDVFDSLFPLAYQTMVRGGAGLFRIVQSGYLRHYVLVSLAALLAGFVGAVLMDPSMIHAPQLGEAFARTPELFAGILMGGLVCASALAIPFIESRVVRVVILGACGFSVVGLYLIYQAPDLALTQLMFEIISVILFVLVLRLLPTDLVPMSTGGWTWRLIAGGTVGLMMGWMTLVAATTPVDNQDKLGHTMAQHSYGNYDAEVYHEKHIKVQAQPTTLDTTRGGGGDNIVNVILVDFRGFDTLGEISVLALAAMGVWSLMPGSWWRKHTGITEADDEEADAAPEGGAA